MLGIYASVALILVAAALVGQAVFAIAGRRQWSWLSPAVGLGVLTALAWGTVRLPGEGRAALVALGVAALVSLAVLRGRVAGLADAVRLGAPVAALALAAASLPFIVEGRFGILGTGLNPDMSQHLFATDRLAAGGTERLIDDGYPLGPHALALAAAEGSGASLVQAFGGLTLAISVSAVLAALSALEGLGRGRQIVGALLVGLPYMAASFLIQGAFKETIQALFVLAFAIGLHQLAPGHILPGTRAKSVPAARAKPATGKPSASAEARKPPIWGNAARQRSALVALPLAALAVGATYSYSFPGLFWLLGAAGVWAVAELALGARRASPAVALGPLRRAAPVVAVATGAAALAIAPEVPRMADFAGFETFDPDGAGLGNLFNPISPLEALGIWPSGDFRLDPGDGAMPALGYWIGGAVALLALAYGVRWWLRRGELAVPAALGAAGVLYLYALVAGTPYQESKAIAIAAPLAMLVAARPLLVEAGTRGAIRGREGVAVAGLALAFLGAAAGCTVVALVNGPVGPTRYSPALAELRPQLRAGSTLVLASPDLLAEEHGRDYLVWELRGGRICVEAAVPPAAGPPPAGIRRVITEGDGPPPFAGLGRERAAGPYQVWGGSRDVAGEGPCPLITDSQRAEPGSA